MSVSAQSACIYLLASNCLAVNWSLRELASPKFRYTFRKIDNERTLKCMTTLRKTMHNYLDLAISLSTIHNNTLEIDQKYVLQNCIMLRYLLNGSKGIVGGNPTETALASPPTSTASSTFKSNTFKDHFNSVRNKKDINKRWTKSHLLGPHCLQSMQIPLHLFFKNVGHFTNYHYYLYYYCYGTMYAVVIGQQWRRVFTQWSGAITTVKIGTTW